ncbi:hypothetical protein [Kitasatospora sp. NPDC057223]|uniref:hypothetical protein n=1 Tax=Kitasatospora sp. NPDC057223 TaxID=3346055 RepID=UPI003629874F
MTVHDLARALPAVPELREHCRALAMLDAILSPEWESRYYSFNSAWAADEELAAMRNGSGDEYSIVFSPAGAYLRGFDHECPMSPYGNDGAPWPGVLDDVPPAFRPYVEEPAFSDEDDIPAVTACLWRAPGDDRWQHGSIEFPAGEPDPDGASRLFELLADRSPEAFQRHAEDYYETTVDLTAIRELYALRPLTQQLVTALNPDLTLADLAEDLAETGYPQA